MIIQIVCDKLEMIKVMLMKITKCYWSLLTCLLTSSPSLPPLYRSVQVAEWLVLSLPTLNRKVPGLNPAWGWFGEAKVLCILRHQGIQLILAYSWARPAILEAGKD